MEKVVVNDTTAPAWLQVPANQAVALGSAFSYDVNASDLSSITYSINNSNFAVNSGSGVITNASALSVGVY